MLDKNTFLIEPHSKIAKGPINTLYLSFAACDKLTTSLQHNLRPFTEKGRIESVNGFKIVYCVGQKHISS